MLLAAFFFVWLPLALFVVLAGADFGVGVWLLAAGRSRRADELRDAIVSYFSPLWETNALFLILFLMGLFAAFPAALGLLGRALIPLGLAALVALVARSGCYTLMHHGPHRWQKHALRGFSLSSIASGILLGYAGATLVSGVLSPRAPLLAVYASSPVGLLSLPLSLAGSAHLAAVALAIHARARRSATSEWFRRAAVGSGIAAGLALTAFSAAALTRVTPLRAHLHGIFLATLVADALLFGAGVFALARRRTYTGAALTGLGYLTWIIGGVFAQRPYLIYPTYTIGQAASPATTLRIFVVASAAGLPLLLVACAVLYRVTIRSSPGETLLKTTNGGQ